MSRKSCINANMAFTDVFISDIITILFKEGSDDFWKCLKYASTDALTNPSYTINVVDKYNMIKQNADLTRIKRLKFNNDITGEAHSEIRIFEFKWVESEPRLIDLEIGFEVISHNDIIILDGTGYSRLNVFRNEILRLLRNRVIENDQGKPNGNIGELSALGAVGGIVSYNNGFQGYQFSLMGTST